MDIEPCLSFSSTGSPLSFSIDFKNLRALVRSLRFTASLYSRHSLRALTGWKAVLKEGRASGRKIEEEEKVERKRESEDQVLGARDEAEMVIAELFCYEFEEK
ncbi:hypothetical protein SLA2020_192390 [Shorea laevis]